LKPSKRYALGLSLSLGLVAPLTTSSHAIAGDAPPPPPATATAAPMANVRSADEIAVLYVGAFVYGAGSGVWFDLQTKPQDFLPALLPFAGFTVASVGAVAITDAFRTFHRGEPATIAGGLYLGLGQGVWIAGMQNARSERTGGTAWGPEVVSTVLWGTSTLGAITGTALGFGLHPRQASVSFDESTAIWGGVLAGLVSGAALPNDSAGREQMFIISGVAYNVGIVGGALLAPLAATSVERVRFIDLGGLTGGLLSLGVYAAATQQGFDMRAGAAVGAVGSVAGLVTTWLLTRRMPSDRVGDDASPAHHALALHPTFLPLPGGGGVGVAGSL
jgi:hypothetical protein